MFDAAQKALLAAPLSASAVKQRTQSGRSLSYIESWHAISEANRIFGFDGWNRETVEMKCVSEREREIGARKEPGWSVSYVGKVRVTVGGVVREGWGAGHGIDRDLGLAHESASKECESDAAKRALMTFGNPFGLALYDKTQSNVEQDAPAAQEPQHQAPARNPQYDDPDGQMQAYIDKQKGFLAACKTLEDIQGWTEARAPELDRLRRKNLAAWNALREFKEARIQELIKESKAA